jgi:tetrapyrrole methylase family protein/MazG family protein
MKNWQRVKAMERSGNAQEEIHSMLDGIAKGLPALLRAYELQKKAAKAGFDWPNARQAWDKVREECAEFTEEMERGRQEEQAAEFGDLLFAMINVGRLMAIHPEDALEKTNRKFIRRFRVIEDEVKKSGRPIEDFSLEELDNFWNLAKKQEDR